jgi:hypothetical protein
MYFERRNNHIVEHLRQRRGCNRLLTSCNVYRDTFCNPLIITLFSLGLVSVGCILMILVIIPKLESNFNEEMSLKYMTTTRIITNYTISSENTCRKTQCECSNIQTNITCQENIENQVEGYCNAGSYCCQYINDLCVEPSCFNSLKCNCVRENREVPNFYFNSSDTIFEEKCSGYKCWSNCINRQHICNKRCVYSISNQKCRTDCGLIYTIDYSYIHIPSKIKEINYENYLLSNECLFLETHIDLLECIGLYYNENYIYKNTNQTICSDLDNNCFDEYDLNIGNNSTWYVDITNSNSLKAEPLEIPEFPKTTYEVLTYCITGGLILTILMIASAYGVLKD